MPDDCVVTCALCGRPLRHRETPRFGALEVVGNVLYVENCTCQPCRECGGTGLVRPTQHLHPPHEQCTRCAGSGRVQPEENNA